MAVQQFVDRMFLAWYSSEAIAATMSAGILNFTVINLFVGTAGYVGTFVAQFWGADQEDRIGPIIWQGGYVAAAAALVHLLMIPLAGPFFRLVGHEPVVQNLEVIYFQIICLGAGPGVASAVLAGFFLGRGKTLYVMTVSIAGTIINMFFNYVLIFGSLGFPEMGVTGAAIATLISTLFIFTVFSILVFRSAHEKTYRTHSGWRLDVPLFIRLLRFGLPNGVQFFLSHMSIAAFILLVGRLGTVELAATSIAFNINMLAFMPMIGFGMAVMILVGQNQGQERPDLSERSIYSGFLLTYIYMTTIALLYVIVPHMFLWPFAVKADPGSFAPIYRTTTILLRFVAVYCLFDTLSIIFASGIKGAGDTRFVMIAIAFLSLFGLGLPTYIALVHLNQGLYTAWTIITIYISLLGFIFMFRFLGRKWKTMRVIETREPVLPAAVHIEPALSDES
ncbi:MAG: MATE family efflux transporter [Deltaproteobacteria bacterium]|nr:MATE family efflux transporter [Deltaproteobacteria bacterium]